MWCKRADQWVGQLVGLLQRPDHWAIHPDILLGTSPSLPDGPHQWPESSLMPHCLLTCHMQGRAMHWLCSIALAVQQQCWACPQATCSPGRHLAFLCRERSWSGRTSLPVPVPALPPAPLLGNAGAALPGEKVLTEVEDRWCHSPSVGRWFWDIYFQGIARWGWLMLDHLPAWETLQETQDKGGPVLIPGQQPGPYRFLTDVHADVHLHTQRGHLSPPRSLGHGQRQALSHRGSTLHISCYGGDTVALY